MKHKHIIIIGGFLIGGICIGGWNYAENQKTRTPIQWSPEVVSQGSESIKIDTMRANKESSSGWSVVKIPIVKNDRLIMGIWHKNRWQGGDQADWVEHWGSWWVEQGLTKTQAIGLEGWGIKRGFLFEDEPYYVQKRAEVEYVPKLMKIDEEEGVQKSPFETMAMQISWQDLKESEVHVEYRWVNHEDLVTCQTQWDETVKLNAPRVAGKGNQEICKTSQRWLKEHPQIKPWVELWRSGRGHEEHMMVNPNNSYGSFEDPFKVKWIREVPVEIRSVKWIQNGQVIKEWVESRRSKQ